MSEATQQVQVFEHPDRHKPDFEPSQHVVTSVRVESGRGHDLVTVWNRGGNAGTLVVDAGDGERIARRLLPLTRRRRAMPETETTQDRDALREAVGRGIEEAWKYYNVIYEACDPDDEARQKWVDCITEQVAALVRRELEAPGDDEALWRKYEEAREEFENSAKLYQFAGHGDGAAPREREGEEA